MTQRNGAGSFPSKEEIEKRLLELCPDFVKHYEWEEDGEKFSSWHFKTTASREGERSLSIHTGDGGARLIYEAVQKELKNKFGR